jgi:hypothetical protein
MLPQNRPKKRPISESAKPSESFEFAKKEPGLSSRAARTGVDKRLSESEIEAFVSELTVGFAHRFVAGFEVIIAALSQSPTRKVKEAALQLAREIQAEAHGCSQAIIARIIEAIESGEPDQLRAAECAITRSAELIFEYPPSYTAAGQQYQRWFSQEARNRTQSKSARRK